MFCYETISLDYRIQIELIIYAVVLLRMQIKLIFNTAHSPPRDQFRNTFPHNLTCAIQIDSRS
jgi:hypothetical protein